MQSTGQTSTQAVSFVPMQGSQMIYAITLILLVLSTSDHLRVGFGDAGGPIAPPDAAASLVCDPAFAGLFTPRRPVWGRYEVCTADEPVEPRARDGFTYTAIEHLEALDAFGTAGAYDRSRLAQLYGGRRVQVVRGWRQVGDRFESVMRLSPYPDAALARLREGTMVIRWIAEP